MTRFATFVCVISVFAQPLFFSLNTLLGYKYLGAEDSLVFVSYIVLVFLSVFIIYLLSFIKKQTLSKIEIGFYVFFLLLITNHLIWVLLDDETRFLNDNLILFVSLGITGFFAARTVYSFNAWKEFIRLTEVAVMLIATGLVINSLILYHNNLFFRGVGGASYQTASYYSAMCFGLLGIAIFRLGADYRYSICRTWIITGLNIFFMFMLFIITISNGGRGALILITLYLLLSIYWIISKNIKKFKGLIKLFFVVAPLFFGIIIAFKEIIKIPFIAGGLSRATNFLFDVQGSGAARFDIYAEALNFISDSPLIGYGAFSHWEKTLSPHNFFLDLSLQFGIFISIVLILIVLILTAIYLKTVNTEKLWMITLSIYPFIFLMFSGGYFKTTLFWFGLASFLFIGSSFSSAKKNTIKISLQKK